MASPLNNDQKLIEQYHEAHETQRKLLELFWQESSVIVAIAGAVVVAAYYYITDALIAGNMQYQVLRTVLVVFGSAMSYASAITAAKHRYWRQRLLDKIADLENQLGLTPLPLQPRHLPKDAKPSIFSWEKLSAEKMLVGCLLFIAVIFSILGVYNIVYLIVSFKTPAISSNGNLTIGYWLQITGLVLGFFGGIVLTLTEIKSRKEIVQEAKTYVGKNPYQQKDLEQKSALAIVSTIFLALGFLLQLIGMAIR